MVKMKYSLIQALELMDMGVKVVNTKYNAVFWFENGKLKSNDNYCSLSIHSQSLLKEKVWEEYEEKPILDIEEKAYLENVLRPFKDRVNFVHKRGDNEYEHIAFETDDDFCTFPYFKKGTMYKGMEFGKEYTLKELGLFDRKIY